MKKLVRDKIPELIKDKTSFCVEVLRDDEEYFLALKNKLLEEVNEFIEASFSGDRNHEIEELADIFEVIETICKYKKYDRELIQSCKLKKKEERGGFDKRLLLLKKDND